MRRWRAVEHKSVPELQAEERAALAALQQRGGPFPNEVVYEGNPFTGFTEVKAVTDEHPSAESRRLAAALAAMGNAEAEAPAPTLWDPHPEDTRRRKWFDDLELALENQSITTREWGRLLEGFGRLGRTRGWFGEETQ